MARKSRKHLYDPKPPKPKNPYDFIAGGYIRVSASDSSSVDTQKHIIQSFIDKNPDIFLKEFYIDDGKSSFIDNRYAFYRMIGDIENKVINGIIVKDISRFGRDDLSTAAYIQNQFPVLGARFIAITDNHDSHSDAENLDFSFLFKSLINYTYSRDISIKVKSVIKLKQERGEYIGAALPYGYKKQKTHDATQYVIDKNTVEVVRNIFLWAAQGDTGYKIASRLNSQNVPSPGEYRKQTTDDSTPQYLWTRNTVMSILRNQFFIGCLVMRKTKTNWWQMRKPVRVAKSDWIKSFDHHDPIIEQELFQKVQQILDSRQVLTIAAKHSSFQNDYLGSRLFCGDCGRKMKRQRVKSRTYYVCPRYAESKGTCTSKRINESTLLEDIFDSIQMEIDKVKAYCEKQLVYEQSLDFKIKNDYLQTQSLKLSNEIISLDGTLRKRYEALADNAISDSDYMLMKDYIDEQRNFKKAELYEILAELEHYQRNVSSNSVWVNKFLKFASADVLAEDMYNMLVERVNVRGTGIEVVFSM